MLPFATSLYRRGRRLCYYSLFDCFLLCRFHQCRRSLVLAVDSLPFKLHTCARDTILSGNGLCTQEDRWLDAGGLAVGAILVGVHGEKCIEVVGR